MRGDMRPRAAKTCSLIVRLRVLAFAAASGSAHAGLRHPMGTMVRVSQLRADRVLLVLSEFSYVLARTFLTDAVTSPR